MKIAVFGGSGQVASELMRRAPADVSVTRIGRDRADFSAPDTVAKAARTLDANAIINAAAYTAVDRAESEEDLATRINGASVGALADVCADRAIPLVHLSTDYVFDGSGITPWSPNMPPNPIGAYGRGKRIGEDLIRQSGARHAIVRTSWVFSAFGTNFVKTMLRLGRERDELRIVADQIGGPTPAADIAEMCFAVARKLANGASGGTYHFAGTPALSWADFAREIFDQSKIQCDIVDIPTTDYPTPAARPLNSRMDCAHLFNDFGVSQPDWRIGLTSVLKELSTA